MFIAQPSFNWVTDKNCSLQRQTSSEIRCPVCTTAGKCFIVEELGCSKAEKTPRTVAMMTNIIALAQILNGCMAG